MRLLLFLLCAINGLALPLPLPTPLSSSIHFELVRNHHHRSNANFIRDLARSDVLRQKMIAGVIKRRRESRRRRATELLGNVTTNVCSTPSSSSAASSFALPVSSGAYAGTGQYFVRFYAGTPPQKFLLVVDTGSDLTWMKCKYSGADGGGGGGGGRGCRGRKCGSVSGRGGKGRVFDADTSKSFDPIGCSSSLCKNSLPFSLTVCPSSTSPCLYDYGYADGSTARGFFANESIAITLSNGQKENLEGIVVGCTSSSVGSSFKASDGVLGLGYSDTSFAARATARFSGKFSYCLVDHLSPKNVSDYLVFGEDYGENRMDGLRYTDLLIQQRIEPFYAVRVMGISIGNEMLKISRVIWDIPSGGGTILDSGTSLTILTQPAYKAVTSALSRALAGYPRVNIDPFEFCYNLTAATATFDEGKVPRMVVHLGGFNGSGLVRLEPPAKSYVVDVADGVKCLGFLSATWPGVSTIGNILQQNHRWEFDVAKRRLGFRPSSC